MKKPTGSVQYWFYKPKTKPKKNRAKPEKNQKNQAKPV